MKTAVFCKSYFNGFQDVLKFRKNNKKTNVLAVLKILSYFTVLIPLSFAVTYCTASLSGRVSKKETQASRDQNVDEKVKQVISKKSNRPHEKIEHIIDAEQPEIVTQENIEPTADIEQPEIVSDDWGVITLKVDGVIKTFKDVIILPSEKQQIAEEWNWRWGSESMHHHPGVRIDDIDHLILSKTSKPDVIILTQGRGHGGKRDNPGPGVLEIAAEVRDYIERQGISEVYILKTAAALEKYSEIRNQGKKRIAALIHTTC